MLEAIILAGGLGTRLRGVIGEETSKCMAPVAGKPFLHYLIHFAVQNGITRIVLSLGHKSEAVTDWLVTQRFPLQIDWVIETEPLGTGGGIRLAMEQCCGEHVVIFNGDTMFTISISEFLTAHRQFGGETTIALKAMQHFERYGTVHTDVQGRIQSFEEKAPKAKGNINGGVYLIDREVFLGRHLPQKFSFEKDYLERYAGEEQFFGYSMGPAMDAYFIDIGVPEDYAHAQKDFPAIFPS